MKEGDAALSKEVGHGLVENNPPLSSSTGRDEEVVNEPPAEHGLVPVRMSQGRLDRDALETGKGSSDERALSASEVAVPESLGGLPEAKRDVPIGWAPVT
jgi:hypothetical protein